MSGTNQSKPVKKLEEIDMKQTNNLNPSLSSNGEGGTVENSNINIETVQDDTEGNLQLQIQEAIAATIRASRQSIAVEQELNTCNSNSASSTSQNTLDCENSNSGDQKKINNEAYKSCDSNSPSTSEFNNAENVENIENTIQTNLQEDMNDTTSRTILVQNKNLLDEANHCNDYTAEDMQSKLDITEEKQTEDSNKGCNSEVSSSQDISVDSEQEKNLEECNSNMLDKDDSTTNFSNENDSKITSKENLENSEVVETSNSHSYDSDSKQTTNIMATSSNDDQGVRQLCSNDEDAKSKESATTNLKADIQETSCIKGDVTDKHTKNLSENPDSVQVTALSKNNAEDDKSKESTSTDLKADKQDTSCIKGDVTDKDTKNLAESPDSVEVAAISKNNAEDEKGKESTTTNVKADKQETSCIKGDVTGKDTKNLAESPDFVEVAALSENSAEDEKSKESTTTNLKAGIQETGCIKGDVTGTDTKNLAESPESVQVAADAEDDKSEKHAAENLEVVNKSHPDGSEDSINEDVTKSTKTTDIIHNPPPIKNNDEKVESKEQIQGDQASCSKGIKVRAVKALNKEPENVTDIPDSKSLICNETLPVHNEGEENDKIKANTETSERIFTKVAEEKDPLATELNREDICNAISKMQGEDIFPVIEIIEEEPGTEDVVEVIDVEKSKVIPTKQGLNREKVISRAVSKNHFAGGACIEILSDDDEVQEVQVEPNSLVQESVTTDVIEAQKNHLEDILQQVKMLTSTEYLLFYLKLPPKWEHDKIGVNPTDTIRNKLENNEIIIPDKNTQILKAIDASIKESSRNMVQDIVDRVKDLTVKEYLWLRCYLPSHSINPNLQHCLLPHGSTTTSQTVLWLKSHLEECPESMLLKQEVFNKYENFCKQNNIHVLSASRFGKLMNQVFPKIGRKRLRAKGNSAYYYVGLRPRCKLDCPRLPKLQQKLMPTENVDLKCEIETNIAETSSQPEKPSVVANGVNNSHRRKRTIVENDSDTSYRSNQLDGQTILIHDPLALLNISTNDNKSLNDASFHQSAHSVKNSKFTKTSFQMHNHSGGKYKAAKPQISTTVSNIRKVKYKEYKHPSVQKVFKNFNTIVLPTEVFRININPSVVLDNTEMNNWFGERLEKYAQKLSNIVIKQVGSSQNFDVTFTCCNDDFEISDSYAKQLHELKANVSNIVIKKSENSSNYKVGRISFDVPSENQTFRITKQLTNCNKSKTNLSISEMKNIKHISVQKLCEKFKNIALPEEIFKSDIDPVIVLNSGEVIQWYIKQLNHLKCEVSNVKSSSSNSDVKLLPQITSSSRQSKAKMMNFCELDSSDDDDDDNIPVAEYRLIAFENKNPIEDPMLPVNSDDYKISVSEINNLITNEIVNEPVYTDAVVKTENTQQRVCAGQKRVISDDEDTNEIEQKRKRFYCSKITISPNYKASVSEEQPFTSNAKQISYIQENSNESLDHKSNNYICPFCTSIFDQKPQFVAHKKTHLFCTTCKRNLKTVEAMIDHLIKHCSLNKIKNQPRIKLQRIDTVPVMLKKYARAFKEPVLNYFENTNKSNLMGGLVSRSNADVRNKYMATTNPKRTYSKFSRYAAVRFLKPTPNVNSQTPIIATSNIGETSENQTVVCNPPQPEPMFQLKNTISNNLNKILLLSSNNVSQSQIQSPNIVYGTLYLNNTSGQSSPNICLNSPLYTPTASASALNTNPSCSNPDLQQPPTFMQIVESPNASVMQYASPITQNNTLVTFEQHQDHSYHQQQQQLFQVGNNIPNMGNIVFVSNSVPQISEVQSATINTSTTNFQPLEQSVKTNEAETANLLINSTETANPPQGQFKIRVKSIQELR